MSEPDPAGDAALWLRYADEDLDMALVAQNRGAVRHTCYLAQQAAEKAIKAGIVFLGIDRPDATTSTDCEAFYRHHGAPLRRTATIWHS